MSDEGRVGRTTTGAVTRIATVTAVVGALLVGGGIGPDGAGVATRPGAHLAASVHPAAGTPGPDAVTAFGTATAVGGSALPGLSAGIVGIAATPDGGGYWEVASDGGVFTFGDAPYLGSLGGTPLNAPIVGIAASPTGAGYWLVAADGGVFAFGDAGFHGSTGGLTLNQPVVGLAATPDGGGYWLVAADGGIFAFGDAPFEGSTGGLTLNQPVVGLAAAGAGGYWLVAADGGIFAFGDAPYLGSLGGAPLNAPIVGLAPTADAAGYTLVASDGGVFAFGDAPFEGSDAGSTPAAPAVGIAARAGGYWLAYGSDRSSLLVPAIAAYAATRADDVTVAVDDLRTGRTIEYRPGVVEHTASTLKVDILATLLTQAQAAGRALTPDEQSLAVPMIEDSLDSAADTLWGRLGPSAVGAFERSIGMTGTSPATDGIWGSTTTTATDRLAMVRAVVEPDPELSDASRAYILDLMEHITPSQDWGATGGVPAGVTVALKNGFAIDDGWQINTEGWVDGGGRDYLIAVLTDGNASEGYGIDTVDAISALVWQDLGS